GSSAKETRMARIVRKTGSATSCGKTFGIKPRLSCLAVSICAAIAQMPGSNAYANSATGVDTVLGNALNPATPAPPIALDGAAWSGRRTPTGRLYGIPYALPEEQRTTSDGWQYGGWLEFGGLFGDADNNAALFRMYKDLDNGIYGNNFGFRAEKPDGARFVEGIGGGIGRDDQFYGIQFGRYNDWKVKLFYNETPHVFTTTYRSLWDNVGSDNLTLRATTPPLLPAGGGASAAASSSNIAAALKTISDSELKIVRKKGGASVDVTFSESWKAYATYTHEKREGARPLGAVWAGANGTGNLEIPESIDYTTHDFAAGVRYRDALQSFNAQFSASLFRNNIDTMTFANPLTVTTNNIGG